MTAESEETDLRARAFAWYWRRRARRGAPRAVLREIAERVAFLQRLARRVEARLSPASSPAPADGAVWTVRPVCLREAQLDSAATDPPSGLSVGPDVKFYHDCDSGVFALCQRPVRGGRTRFEIFFESYQFAGSYLSFAYRVPDGIRRPAPGERLRLAVDVRASRPMKTFVRLNISRSGAVETFYAEGELGDGTAAFDFDMIFAPFELRQEDAIWCDLILDRPRMMEFAIRDLSVSLIGAGG